MDVSLLHSREGNVVERVKLEKKIKVTASKLPEKIKLFVDVNNDGVDREVSKRTVSVIAGHAFKPIKFQIFDGAGNSMDLGEVFDAGWRMSATWIEDDDNSFRKSRAEFVKGFCPPGLKGSDMAQSSAVKHLVEMKEQMKKKTKKSGGREKSKSAASGAQRTFSESITVSSVAGKPDAIKIKSLSGERMPAHLQFIKRRQYCARQQTRKSRATALKYARAKMEKVLPATSVSSCADNLLNYESSMGTYRKWTLGYRGIHRCPQP